MELGKTTGGPQPSTTLTNAAGKDAVNSPQTDTRRRGFNPFKDSDVEMRPIVTPVHDVVVHATADTDCRSIVREAVDAHLTATPGFKRADGGQMHNLWHDGHFVQVEGDPDSLFCVLCCVTLSCSEVAKAEHGRGRRQC